MGFNAELFQTLTSQGVPAEAAVKAATTPDAPVQAPVAPQATFQPPANVVQPQAAAPVPAAAKGSLAQAFAQGSKSNGHGPAAKFPAVGSKVDGVVARDMTDLDVTQETDYATKQPKFERDGVTPKWQMTIPLNVAPSADFPEGKTTVWVKGRMLKSTIRGMLAAGYDVNNNEALREGDRVQIERIADSPTNYGNAAREYNVVITRGQGAGSVPVAPETASAPSTSPAPATPAAQPAAPAASTPGEAAPGLTPEQQALIAQYAGK